MQKEFVLGFAFSQDKKRIALILKNRPLQLAGKLSVPGGHVEAGDINPQFATAREFAEETGVNTHPGDWRHLETFAGFNGSLVHVYMAVGDKFMMARTCSDEEVFISDVEEALADPRMDDRAASYIRRCVGV